MYLGGVCECFWVCVRMYECASVCMCVFVLEIKEGFDIGFSVFFILDNIITVEVIGFSV